MAGAAERKARRSSGAPDDGPTPDQRILSLLLLLLGSGPGHTREEIFSVIPAYRTGKPEAGLRKFERDKKDLRALGIEIEEDADDHTYAIDRRGYELPTLKFEEDEREALIVAADVLRSSTGIEHRDLIDQALRKLAFDREPGRERIPPRLGVHLAPREMSAKMEKHLAVLRTAVENRKRVALNYAAPHASAPTRRDVDPYALVYRAGDWQLVGHCHLRAALRTFRVDRIGSLRAAPRPAHPDFDPPPGWNLASFLDRSPWVFEVGAAGGPVAVTLEIAPERAWVADESFGVEASRETFVGADGGTWSRIRFRSGNPDYVVGRVLEAAGHLVVAEPAGLRERVRRSALEIAGRGVVGEGAPS